MAQSFHQLLAKSLHRAKKVAQQHIVKSADISRMDRERLLKAGSLQRIIRGWYILCQPHTIKGESTIWYASYWDFITQYLNSRFGEHYCLSATSSMDLYLGKNTVPKQIVVMIKQGGSTVIPLPFETSLMLYLEDTDYSDRVNHLHGINVLTFEYALSKLPANFYRQHPQDAEIALRLLNKPEDILNTLLKYGMTTAAGRLSGALKAIGREELANSIVAAMQSAGYAVTVENPFKVPLSSIQLSPASSPYKARIEGLWRKTREIVLSKFPPPEKNNQDADSILKQIDARYTQDAYHSLSIEGYQVTEHLIEKIASGDWQPDNDITDQQQRNAMAAKGYFEAFKAVKKTIVRMLKENPAEAFEKDFQGWYLSLFSPSVMAGIIPAESLAGFRQQPVYIRQSQHVPPPFSAVRDCMDGLFELMKTETQPAINAVLGHWLIGYIHPYIDGNGRMARFAMNAWLVSHGYPWTVIQVKNRQRYLTALESASIESNLAPFCQLILDEMQAR